MRGMELGLRSTSKLNKTRMCSAFCLISWVCGTGRREGEGDGRQHAANAVGCVMRASAAASYGLRDGLPGFAVVRGGEFLAAGGSKRGGRGVLGGNGREIGLGRGMDLFPGDAIDRAIDCALCADNPAHVPRRSAAGSKFRVRADKLTIPGCAAVGGAGNESSTGQTITNLRVGGWNGDGGR